MYERFFGLRERPFELAPNPRFLFLSGRQREALGNLRYGLSTSRGLTLLLGEAGSGKTTLLSTVLNELDRERIQCVLLSNPVLTRTEFYEALAGGFQLSVRAAASKALFLAEMSALLAERAETGLLTALVLDEAQSLSNELLEETRLLSNLETTTTKLLNVVLAGQPELAQRLNEPALRPLKQRIVLRCRLLPLDLLETASYIAGRLRIAGGVPSAIFTREAVAVIHAASGGLPRVINVICENALLGGFAGEIRPVTRAVVDEVLEDFDLGSDSHFSGSEAEQDSIPARPEPEPSEQEERPAAETDGERPAIFAAVNRNSRVSFF